MRLISRDCGERRKDPEDDPRVSDFLGSYRRSLLAIGECRRLQEDDSNVDTAIDSTSEKTCMLAITKTKEVRSHHCPHTTSLPCSQRASQAKKTAGPNPINPFIMESLLLALPMLRQSSCSRRRTISPVHRVHLSLL